MKDKYRSEHFTTKEEPLPGHGLGLPTPETGDMLRRMVYGTKSKGSAVSQDGKFQPTVPGFQMSSTNADALMNLSFKQNTALMHEVMKQLLEQYNTITCEEAEQQLNEFTRLASKRIMEEHHVIMSSKSKTMGDSMKGIKDIVILVEGYRSGTKRFNPNDPGMFSPEEAKRKLHQYAIAANEQWSRENIIKQAEHRVTKEGLSSVVSNSPQPTTVMDVLIVEETALMVARKLRCAKEKPEPASIPSFEDLYPLFETGPTEKKEQTDVTVPVPETEISQASGAIPKQTEENKDLSPHEVIDKLSSFASLVTKQTFEGNTRRQLALKTDKKPEPPDKDVDTSVAQEVMKRYQEKFNILINSSLRITGDKMTNN
jgi:hypothetical protein